MLKVAENTKQAMIKAYKESDYGFLGGIMDTLRLSYGLNYQQTYELFNSVLNIDVGTYDHIAYMADMGY